jgi:hypothetical protein
MRKLTLSREVLTELNSDELGQIVGAQATAICLITNPCITRPVTGLTCYLTGNACA